MAFALRAAQTGNYATNSRLNRLNASRGGRLGSGRQEYDYKNYLNDASAVA
jgi:hypothetical protein